jgi:uncharacterized membrane protein (DUF441 family)
MADTLNASVPTLAAGPYVGCLLINYTADQTWSGVARGVYLTTGGTLKVDFANGTTGTLAGLITGTVYPFAIMKIYQTGSATAAGYVLF